MDDEVYRTAAEKDVAILILVKQCQKRQQPVLVGTVSIEKSEHLSALLKKEKVEHSVLNARHHEQEAMIIARAGEPGSVTIATNMAGRGTDIQLGGNLDMLVADALKGVSVKTRAQQTTDKITTEIESRKKLVLEAGGLYIVGTERHESRRIDNQLRGRAGRQGDLGASKFFLSLEDDLMRIFGSERIDIMLQKLGLEEGEAIVHPWVNKALEKAQQKVEARNFEIRKNLLKFDDVMNDQRKVIFEQRKELMASDDVSEEINEMREQVIDDIVARCIPEKAYAEQWDTDTLHEEIMRIFGKDLPIAEWAKEEGIADAEIRERLNDVSNRLAAEKVANYGADVIRSVEKNLLLQMLDQVWKEHLLTLDHLRQGIGLRAYAQRDPLNEYKRESFNLFEEMLDTLRERLTQVLSHIELQPSPSEESQPEMTETRDDPAFQQEGGILDSEAPSMETPIRSRQASSDVNPKDASTWGRVARNAPCPCGSKKKYKHCHGQV
jgi:preprotein translocase subunit SecA